MASRGSRGSSSVAVEPLLTSYHFVLYDVEKKTRRGETGPNSYTA